MKILVTGAAGFIGSFTSRELIKKGHEVIGIDNFDEFYELKAKQFNLDLINYCAKNSIESFSEKTIKGISEKIDDMRGVGEIKKLGSFQFHEIDILDETKLNALFEENEFDAVIHLAAMGGVSYSIEVPVKYMKVNIEGDVKILEQCAKNSIVNFVFASSSSVYGNLKETPFSETVDVNMPISQYAASKRMGEIINYTYHHLYGINIANLRFFTVYGPLQRPAGMVIQRFIRQTEAGLPMSIFGDGSMARDYTYIDDIVNGIILAMENNEGYEIYNLGKGDSTNLNDLAEIVKTQMGNGKINYLESPPTEVDITFADISKAKKNLSYEPKVNIEEGVRRQIETFKLMPEWYKKLDLN